MNTSDTQLTEIADRLLDLLGELPNEERQELRGWVCERIEALFRLDGLPEDVAAQLGPPLAGASSLVDWCRQRMAAGNFAEDGFGPLRTAAALVDHIAATDRPLLAFLPAACQVGADGKLCVQAPRLDLGRFQPALKQLTEYQRKYVGNYLHPNLLRSLTGADLMSAGVYSFALFLLDTFLGIQAPTRGELQDALDRCPQRSGPAIPPDLPALFRQVVTAPVNKPLGWTCRELVSAVLRSFRDNVFACAATVDQTVRHRSFAYSVPGLNKAGGNEDRYAAWSQGPASLLLVADGVSTADLGSGAMAAEEILRVMDFEARDQFHAAVEACLADPQVWPEPAEHFLTDFFEATHRRVIQQINTLYAARKDGTTSPQAPMCSTLTAAFVFGDQALIHFIGDSPALLFSPSRNLFCKLTGEHHASLERGFSFGDRHDSSLTRVIGACELSLIEQRFVPTPQCADRVRVQLRRGDWLMLASDGLVEGIDAPNSHEKTARLEAELRRLTQSGTPLKKLVRKLVALAEDGLSNDNITLNALQIEPEEEAHG